MENGSGNQIGLMSSLYRPLKDGDVDRIVDDALKILEQTGMLVFSKTAREAFARAGAKVDEPSRRCYLPRALVEDAIASNPSSISLCSRDGKTDCVLEKNRVHYGTGGTAIYVLDPDSGERRPSTVRDVALNARVVDTLDNIHLLRSMSSRMTLPTVTTSMLIASSMPWITPPSM